MTVAFLSVVDGVPASSYWDHALLRDLLADQTSAIVEHGFCPAPDTTIVVVPGAGHAGHEDAVAEAVAHLDQVALVVTSDEEHRFDASRIDASQRWRQYAHPDDGCRPFPVGYPPHLRPNLAAQGDLERYHDISFAGQVTHDRRVQAAEAVAALDGEVFASKGFTQGLPPEAYARLLARSRIVACPSGPCHPDTFRIYEALEAGCVPLVDGLAPGWGHSWWPSWQFDGPVPFPVVVDWSDIGGVVTEVLADWAWWAARCQAWWVERKAWLRSELVA